MRTKKIHLRGLGYTLCGIGILTSPYPRTAKTFNEVTCKNCMKHREYKMFLAGRFIEKPKILKTIKCYTIYNTPNLDTDSLKTSKSGHIEIVCKGVYTIKGDLPKYMVEELARIAEERGLKWYYNNGSYFAPHNTICWVCGNKNCENPIHTRA